MEAFMKDYLRDGYFLLRNVLTDEDLDPVTAMISDYVEGQISELYEAGHLPEKYEELPFTYRWAKACSIHNVNKAHWNQEVFSREIYDLLKNPLLLSKVEQIIGPDILANGDYFVRPKLPNESLTTLPWHQDAIYFGGTAGNPDHPILTVWIPLVDVNERNGCLQIIPESEKWGLIPYKKADLNRLEPVEKVEERGQVITVEMNKGDVLVFNQLTLHRSLPNQSDQIRWNIDLRYSGAELGANWHGLPNFTRKYPPFICQNKTDRSKETTWEEWLQAHDSRLPQ